MWIKICGITSLKDAVQVAALGVDAIGFIFAHSPRRVPIDQVKMINKNLKNILRVGVFVNEEADRIRYLVDECKLDVVQLHGDESPSFCATLNVKVIKALRLKDIESIKKISLYKNTWKILIDTHDPQKMGGTGKTLSLDILDSIEDYSDIILAGGLNADNVLSHIDKYSPFGIDASSSIESSPGIKDSSKLIKFVQTVKNRGMYEK